jgi:hypothetical protein
MERSPNMSRLTSAALVSVALLFFLSNSKATAEPTFWSYSTRTNTNLVTDGGQTPTPYGLLLSGASGTGADSKTIPIAFVKSFDPRPNAASSGFSLTRAPYAVEFTLTDERSHQSSSLMALSGSFGPTSVSGWFTGRLDAATHTATLSAPLFPARLSLRLGNNWYFITMLSDKMPIGMNWVPNPQNPAELFSGGVEARVDVAPADVAQTPEPSCLALAGTGLACVMGFVWRKRRASLLA